MSEDMNTWEDLRDSKRVKESKAELKALEEIERLKKLITELCDALEWWENHTSYEPPFAVELKKHAREATR